MARTQTQLTLELLSGMLDLIGIQRPTQEQIDEARVNEDESDEEVFVAMILEDIAEYVEENGPFVSQLGYLNEEVEELEEAVPEEPIRRRRTGGSLLGHNEPRDRQPRSRRPVYEDIEDETPRRRPRTRSNRRNHDEPGFLDGFLGRRS